MVDSAAFERAIHAVAGLESELHGIVAVAAARAYPAFLRNDDGDRFIDDLLFDHGFFGLFHGGAALVAELLAVGFDFTDQPFFHRGWIVEQVLQRRFFVAQFG